MGLRKQFTVTAARISSIILAAGGAVLLFIFLYFVYYYGWTEQRHFTTSLGVALYYVLPAGLACLLFASLKLKPTYRINLTLLCVSLITSLYSVELIVELAGSGRTMVPKMSRLGDSDQKEKEAAKLAEQFGLNIDLREGSRVISDFQEQGIDAVPFISPPNNLFVVQPDGHRKSVIDIDDQEVVPLAGISNKFTVLCNENGQWITYVSDRHGFNNPDEIWQSEHVDVAVLGDSFAHGYCVPNDRTFAGLIRHQYPSTMNLAIAGNGPLFMLAAAKEYLPHFKPKIVLWFYFEGNDLSNLAAEKNSLLINYLKDNFNQPALMRQAAIDEAMIKQVPKLKALEVERRRTRLANRRRIIPYLIGFAKLSTLRQGLNLVQGTDAQEVAASAQVQGPMIDLFRDVLSMTKARVSAWGGQLYFVYLPTSTRFFDTPEIGVKQRVRVLDLVANLGIPIIDVSVEFQAHPDVRSLFPFREHGHYNERGHEIVARAVLKALP